jgi:hypothetical protein
MDTKPPIATLPRTANPVALLDRAWGMSEIEQLSEFLEFEALAACESDASPSEPEAAKPAIRPLPPSELILSFDLLSQGSSGPDEEGADRRNRSRQKVRLDEHSLSDSYADESDDEHEANGLFRARGQPSEPVETVPGLAAREILDSESDSASDAFKGNP